MGNYSICLGYKSEYSFYGNVRGQREKAVGSVSGIVLLHLVGLASSFVLKIPNQFKHKVIKMNMKNKSFAF